MLNPKITLSGGINEIYKNIREVSAKCCLPTTFPNHEIGYKKVCDSLRELEENILPKEYRALLSCAKSSVCGKIFLVKEPIYICRDCATDNTCVLCRDCFMNSEHQNHNYELRSSNGGTCDCGDGEAWKSHANCSIHSKDDTIDLNATVFNPDYVMSVDEATKDLPKVLVIGILKFSQVLLNSFQEIVMKKVEYEDEKSFLLAFEDLNVTQASLVIYNNEYHNYDQVINIFKRCLHCTAEHAMALANIVDRDGRCLAVFNENLESVTAKNTNILSKSKSQTGFQIVNKMHAHQYLSMQNYLMYCLQWFYELLDRYPKIRVLVCYNMLIDKVEIKHEGQLFLFPKMNFIQKIIESYHDLWKYARNLTSNFILTTTFKDIYFKRVFAEVFLENYHVSLTSFSRDDHNYEDSVISLTCQYFTVISIAYYMVEHKDILVKLISIIHEIFLEHSKPMENNPNIMQFTKAEDYTHRKFDSYDRQMRIFIDIKYILRSILTQTTGIAENNDSVMNLTIKPVSEKMVDNFIRFYDILIKCLVLIQDINTIERVTTHHIEHDPQHRLGIFLMLRMVFTITLSSEFAVSNDQIWQKALDIVMDAFKTRVISHNLKYLEPNYQFLTHEAVVVNNDWPDKYISIVKPIHRMMAPLLTKQKYRKQLPQDMIHFLTDEALQIIVFSSQQLGNMWFRSGNAPFIMNQHMKWSFLFHEMYGRDLEILQEMACEMAPEEFLIKCIHKFDLNEYLSEQDFRSSENRGVLQRSEDFLHLLILTLFFRHRIHVGKDVTKDLISKYMMFHILCVKKMPHSKFVKKLPHSIENLAKHKLNSMLDEISDQSTQSQIMLFSPKLSMIPVMYDRFCPFYSVQDRNEAELNIEGILTKNNKEPVFVPPPPIVLTEHYQHLYAYMTNECFLEIINRYLYFCLTKRIGTCWSDTILDLLIHLICLCLQEDKKLCIDGNPTNRVLFVDYLCSKPEKFDVIGTLESLCDKITAGIQLRSIKWAIRKWYEIKSRNIQLSESESYNMAESMEIDNAHDNKVKLNRADASKRRREQLINKMQTMQKKFVDNNQQIMSDSVAGLEPPKSKINSQELTDDTQTNESQMASTSEGSQVSLGADGGVAIELTKTIQPDYDLVCIVCQEATNNSNKPIVAIAGAWRSTVLSSTGGNANCLSSSQDRSESDSSNIFGSENESSEEDSNLDEVLSNDFNRSNKSLKPSLLIPMQKDRTNIFISTCGHVMHYECQTQYLKNMKKQKRIFARSRGIIQPFIHNRCPLCKCVCNIDIPISRDDLKWRYESAPLKLSYDKWLIEFSEWRPTKEIKTSQNWASNFKTAMFRPICLIKNLSVPPLLRAPTAPVTDKDLLATFPYKTNIVTKLPNSQLKKEVHEAFENLWSDMYPSTAQELVELCHSVSYTLRLWESVYSKENVSFIHNISNRHRDGLYFLIKAVYQAPVVLSNHEQVNQNIQLYVELLQHLVLNSKLSSWMDLFSNTKTPIFIFEVNFLHVWCSLIFLRTLLQTRIDDTNQLQFGFLNKKTFNLHLTKLLFEFQSISVLLSLSPVNIDENHENICENLIKYAPEMWNQESITKLYELRESLVNGYPLMKNISPTLKKSQVVVGFVQSILPFLRCTSFLLTVLGDVYLCEDKGNEIYEESVDIMKRLNLGLISSDLMQNETIPHRVRSICDQLLIDTCARVDSRSSETSSESFERLYVNPGNFLNKSISWMPYSAPKLIELPLEFTDIMTSCLNKGCSVNPQPTGSQYELAVCLLCGVSVCLSGYCCRTQDYNVSSVVSNGAQLHARRVHAGYSLYLSSRTSKIVIVFYNARWVLSADPVYYDRFGEIDSELKRGNPLYLNKPAYQKLEKAWMEHKIGTVVQDISIGQDFFV